ncbi:uncharacterized protein GGS22DRAFT_167555 [Annulohypoxylon maeteangense]|uniref:uncharacterized protein n=1 Tax=Annulohypoxylon maeteangense TaxID=1927788 RepID=UPI002007E861|nr:uncharacterized protein GGS22DRAFT_167555 [Annulohypoxylon maeteangense]KAI0883620.1 hypothetical protein GGS22DRAFT_167555 [Annulohypoxylon maeteangense]
MAGIHRQKACIACADSKRKCDKQLPECQRCLDRDVDCVYPEPKRRRRDYITHNTQAGVPSLDNYAGGDTLESGLNLGDWGSVGEVDFDVSLSDMIPYIPTVIPEGDGISSPPYPWFLQDETWAMQHTNEEAACMTFSELEPLIRAVEEMLRCWVSNGHNSFIHRRLYEKGMPMCLQDAFTTLATYVSRSPAMTETILQIAEERSSTLARQGLPVADGTRGMLNHLAHVQALFVYEFIRLFDGSIRFRASADKQLPILRGWVADMWEAVKRYRGEDDSHQSSWMTSEFDREYGSASEIWRLWILTESVRRTHLIIDTVINVYQIMTRGWAECTGGVMFTARRGLWDAESALEWLEMSRAKPPLLVPSLKPGPLISQHTADEVDDFAKMFWTYIIGPDKIRYWIYKTDKESES